MPPIFDQIYFCNYIFMPRLRRRRRASNVRMDIVLRANGDKIYPRYNHKYNVIFRSPLLIYHIQYF